MNKSPSPLLGYNNNVRHKNRVFHIQTEDSGIKHPHIITHLFMDGGRILKSVKTSYAEQVGAEGMADSVRQMMKEQHKAMFIALRDGQFDELVDAGVAYAAAREQAPASKSLPTQDKIAMGIAPTLAPPPLKRDEPANERDEAPSEKAPATTREPPLELDIEALERASHSDGAPVFKSDNDLPPPNPNTLKRPDTGRYPHVTSREDPDQPRTAIVESIRSPAAARQSSKPHHNVPASLKRPTPRPPPNAAPKPAVAARAASPVPPLSPPARPPPKLSDAEPGTGQGRYAPARPAAIFGQTRPQQGSSIFGEDLISDKSLDEVILSYLAEDLDSEKK